MYMCWKDFGNSSCQEIPDDDAAIIAANGEKGSVFIEGTSECKRHAIQSAIEFFWIILTKRFYSDQKSYGSFKWVILNTTRIRTGTEFHVI